MEAWLADYGYLAVFFAGAAEGELVQVTAGISARAGLLEWHWAWLAGSLGTFLSTSVWFLSGHYAGDRILERRPDLADRVARAADLLDRHGMWLFVFYRFLYGLRTVIPLAIGASGVAPAKFLVVDLLSWLAWFGVVSSVGYYVGDTALVWLEWLFASQQYAVPFVLVIAVGFWYRNRSKVDDEA
jgi:membrane protein DedA with SNARE-associated domain